MRCTEHLAGFLAIALAADGCQPSLPAKPAQTEVKISRDLDCGGRPFQEGREVQLLVKDDGIRISNCRITGTIRVLGLTRNGSAGYGDDDKGYGFGSSADDRDHADFNIVRANVFTGSALQVVDNGKQNAVQRVGSPR